MPPHIFKDYSCLCSYIKCFSWNCIDCLFVVCLLHELRHASVALSCIGEDIVIWNNFSDVVDAVEGYFPYS